MQDSFKRSLGKSQEESPDKNPVQGLCARPPCRRSPYGISVQGPSVEGLCTRSLCAISRCKILTEDLCSRSVYKISRRRAIGRRSLCNICVCGGSLRKRSLPKISTQDLFTLCARSLFRRSLCKIFLQYFCRNGLGARSLSNIYTMS